jgi:hypothetical protein
LAGTTQKDKGARSPSGCRAIRRGCGGYAASPEGRSCGIERLRTAVLTSAWLAVVCTASCKDSAWTPRGSADIVVSEIKLRGATGVSKRLDTDETFARSVMSGIASGDSTWLLVASRLEPQSAAAEASLEIALASALVQSPNKVLALIPRKYQVDQVCGIPFRRTDSSEIITYHQQAITALARVRDSTLTKTLASCRTALDDARNEKLQRVDPGYILKNKPGTTVPVKP